jgi:hypothetical protein
VATANGSRRPRAAGTAAPARKLPPLTVARFEEASKLIEQLVSEKTDVFIEAQNEYRRKHREATDRPLTAQEAAQVAAAMAESLGQDVSDDPGAVAAKIQGSGLRAYDEPQGMEILLAAGLATAPALMDVVMRLVALIELSADAFEGAREAELLDEALDSAVDELRKLEVQDARARASAALSHVVEKTGVAPGEAVRLVTRIVGQAMGQALQLHPDLLSSGMSSLQGSLDSGGPDEPSSTTPPTGTPSN